MTYHKENAQENNTAYSACTKSEWNLFLLVNKARNNGTACRKGKRKAMAVHGKNTKIYNAS